MMKTRRKYTGKPRHIEIHDEEEAENTHAQVTRGNTRKKPEDRALLLQTIAGL